MRVYIFFTHIRYKTIEKTITEISPKTEKCLYSLIMNYFVKTLNTEDKTKNQICNENSFNKIIWPGNTIMLRINA